MPTLHTPASFSGLQCRRDALPQRPAPIHTSQAHKEVVSGSLSPRDAFHVPTERELLAVGVTQKLWHISVGNCLIAYLYVLVSPCLCRISAKKTSLAFLIALLQLPSSTPVICSACNAC